MEILSHHPYYHFFITKNYKMQTHSCVIITVVMWINYQLNSIIILQICSGSPWEVMSSLGSEVNKQLLCVQTQVI